MFVDEREINDWNEYNSCFFTRRRSSSFAEYCKHFVARLNDVHAFCYNSAGSERIWMKFGKLRVYLGLYLTKVGRNPRRIGSGRASRNFFCPLNNARLHRLPVGHISRNLHKNTCFRVLCGAFGKHLWKFARKGSFFPQKNLHFGLIEVNDFRLPVAISPKRLQISASSPSKKTRIIFVSIIYFTLINEHISSCTITSFSPLSRVK